MEWSADCKNGISNYGNQYRIKELMKRAQSGAALKIAFIGGSITQGSLASTPDRCYAARVAAWWQETFPASDVTYINAGVGGTTSQFGCARVQQDVLDKDPDLVIVEFSVNDDSSDLFLETYEGLVRRVWSMAAEPAVLIVHNVRYDNGQSAEDEHIKVARHYGIPSVSMRSTIYLGIQNGIIDCEDITPDGLHPNDYGHSLIADVITCFLQKIYRNVQENADSLEQGLKTNDLKALPNPITVNHYEHAVRYQNDTKPLGMNGFWACNAAGVFQHGWAANYPGAFILFEIDASEIAVQYRKSVQKPAFNAVAVVDGNESKGVLLNANFEEDWGDCLYIDTLLYHGKRGKHTVEIRILPDAAVVPFYLVSVIASS